MRKKIFTIMVILLITHINYNVLAGQNDSTDSLLEITEEARYLLDSMKAASAKINDIHASGVYSTEYITTETQEKQKEVVEWETWITNGGQKFHHHILEDTMLESGLQGEEKERRLSWYNNKLSWIDGVTKSLREVIDVGNTGLIKRDAVPPDILPLGYDPRYFSFAATNSKNIPFNDFWADPEALAEKGKMKASIIDKKGTTWVLELVRYDSDGKPYARNEYEILTDKGFVVANAKAYVPYNATSPTEEYNNEEIEEISPGIWLANNTTYKKLSKKGRPIIFTHERKNVQVNSGFSAKELAISFPQGTLVHDEIIGIKYNMPEDNELLDAAFDSLDLDKVANALAEANVETKPLSVSDYSSKNNTSKNRDLQNSALLGQGSGIGSRNYLVIVIKWLVVTILVIAAVLIFVLGRRKKTLAS